MRIGNWSSARDAAKLVALPVVVIVGFSAWIMLPELSDAEDQAAPQPSAAIGSAQNAASIEPPSASTQSTSQSSTEVTAPADTAAPAAGQTRPRKPRARKLAPSPLLLPLARD